MLKNILKRVFLPHLIGGSIQHTIEAYAWRGVVALSAVAYNHSPKFKAGLDQIIAAVSGG